MTERPTSAASVCGLPRATMVEWLRATCERQGVPVVVRDPSVVTQVAALLGHAAAAPSVRRDETIRRATRDRSQPPPRLNPVDVQHSRAGAAGSDDGVIEDGLHYRLPTVQPEGLPLGA